MIRASTAVALPSVRSAQQQLFVVCRSIAVTKKVRYHNRRLFSTHNHPQQQRDESASSSASSMLKTAAEYFAGLRYKAATSLTESLSSAERTQLLQSFLPAVDNNKNSIASTVTTDHASSVSVQSQAGADHHHHHHHAVSVEEAIAAAVLKERHRNEQASQEVIARAVAQAEAAAHARVETELAIIQHRQQAFAAWQSSVQKENKEKDISSEDDMDQSVSVDLETNSVESKVESVTSHPILGPCIADLGTKRIHVVRAKVLSSIPVWNQQRIYRHDRAKSMALDKMKTAHFGLLGVIGLFENPVSKQLSIIDGQHRVGMMTILEAKGLELNQVLVEVYTRRQEKDESESTTLEGPSAEKDTTDEAYVAAIFEEINKAEPVRFVDMPGIMKSKDRSTLNGGVERLSEKFSPDMFSTSSRCRPPHVNLDAMRDAIFAANVIERHGIKSPKALEDWLLSQNAILKDKFSMGAGAGERISKQALEKAKKNDFYLGLDTTWYQN